MFFLTKVPFETYIFHYISFVLYLQMLNSLHQKHFIHNLKVVFWNQNIMNELNWWLSEKNIKLVEEKTVEHMQIQTWTATNKQDGETESYRSDGNEKKGHCGTVKLAPLTFCEIFLRRFVYSVNLKATTTISCGVGG